MGGAVEHEPGELAPAGGTYRLLDIFGGPTSHRMIVPQGARLPDAPRGHTWRLEAEEKET
jgi:hypothetical protein